MLILALLQVSNVFVVNGLKTPKVFTNIILGNYLVKNGFPLLQKNKNTMVFSETKALSEMIDNLPIHIKLLGKVIT